MLRGRPASGDVRIWRQFDTGTTMTGPQTDEIPGAMVRSLQIVVALVFGVLAFAGLALAVGTQGVVPVRQGEPLLSYLAVGFSVMTLAIPR